MPKPNPIQLSNEDVRAIAVDHTVKNKTRNIAHRSLGWTPGQSGNPGGRVRNEQSLTYLMRDALAEAKRGHVSYAMSIVRKVRDMADGGDLGAAKLIFSYIDGKPIERISVDASVQYTETEQVELSLIHKLEATNPELLRTLMAQTVSEIAPSTPVVHANESVSTYDCQDVDQASQE